MSGESYSYFDPPPGSGESTPQATETVAGKAELATQTETNTGTDDARIVTPAKLAGRSASETQTGIVELATDTETQTGTDTARAITPSNLSARTATQTRTGVVELATDAETQTGTDTARAITPSNLSARTATETRGGVAELATQSETDTATDDTRIVTPLKLGKDQTSGVATLNASRLVDAARLGSGTRDSTKYLRDDNTWQAVSGGSQATETAAGVAELATQTETNTGTDDLRIVTPLKAASATFVTNKLRTSDLFYDFVVSGNVPATSANLQSTTPAQVAYVSGVRVAPSSETNHAYTASRDTYVDLGSDGVLDYNAVTNGAAAPSLAASHTRLFKVVTSATAVTGVTDMRMRDPRLLKYLTANSSTYNLSVTAATWTTMKNGATIDPQIQIPILGTPPSGYIWVVDVNAMTRFTAPTTAQAIYFGTALDSESWGAVHGGTYAGTASQQYLVPISILHVITDASVAHVINFGVYFNSASGTLGVIAQSHAARAYLISA